MLCAAFFGPTLLTDDPSHILTLPIRTPSDQSGCPANTTDVNGRSYAGSAVLLYRLGCTFGARALQYAALGAKLMIFAQCSPNPPSSCSQGPFESISSLPNITIPVIQIDFEPFSQLRNAISAAGSGPEVTMQVFGTYRYGGGTFPADKAAMTAAYQANPTITWPDIASGTRPWADLVSANPPDPCLQRVMGVWCERGRITTVNAWTPGTWVGALPDELGDLSEVRYVNVGGNRLTSVGCGFTRMRKLQYLNIAVNRISSLPPCWSNLSSTLQQFAIGTNLLTELPDFSKLNQMRQFDANANQLHSITIPTSWQGMTWSCSFLSLSLSPSADAGDRACVM